MLDRNTWNHLIVYKQMNFGLFKMLPENFYFTNHINLIYKQNLALNNRQTQPTFNWIKTFNIILVWDIFILRPTNGQVRHKAYF